MGDAGRSLSDPRDAAATLARAVTAKTTAAVLCTLAVAIVAALALGGSGDARGAATATAGAEAFARSGSAGESGRVSVSGDGVRRGAGTRVAASTAGGRATAEATVSLPKVNLFGGLVTAGATQVSAKASGAGTTVSGSVADVAVHGKPIGSFTSAATHDLGGYGRLEILASDGTSITALRVTLTKPYKGWPAGSTMSVAYASATARDGAPPRERTTGEPRPSPRPGPAERREREPGRDRDGGAAEEAADQEGPPVEGGDRRAAPELDALPTDRGYVFPVWGDDVAYGNDWGAPRQHTGRHEGTDLFAPEGTPVLAVTDGTLYRVGTRKVPGNRLWLRSPEGHTFFYAHLSAFAHDARNGKRVRAGDVVGFVGSTGDAEHTPPHLHFEIHPLDGEAVNPYPFLRAWQARRDVPTAAWLARYGNDPSTRPGALVVLEDWLER
jgi:murein DD-endopeptidase MepM/ murein hydrolase activator NlpD